MFKGYMKENEKVIEATFKPVGTMTDGNKDFFIYNRVFSDGTQDEENEYMRYFVKVNGKRITVFELFNC